MLRYDVTNRIFDSDVISTIGIKTFMFSSMLLNQHNTKAKMKLNTRITIKNQTSVNIYQVYIIREPD
jgi:hypothetical protein